MPSARAVFMPHQNGYSVLRIMSIMGVVGAAGLLAGPVFADSTAGSPITDSSSGDAARLLESKKCEPYEVSVPGSTVPMGAARIAVQAPLRTVRSVLTDYGRYSEFMPEFHKSRIIGRNAAGTDVYLEVPILHGAARLWTVARFTGPVSEGNGTERIEGRQQSAQGNIDDLRAIWRLRAADENHTILALELLLVPKLPVPASILTSELRDAAERAVTATRTRAELSSRGRNANSAEVAGP